MSHIHRATHHVDADALFTLAAGELPAREADVVNAHLAVCRGCRRLYAGARELHREAVRLGDAAASGADEVTHRRLWRSLAPEAAAAAERVQQHRAWAIVLGSPRLRWAAAVLVLVSAGLLVYGLGRRPATPSDSTIAGASAAHRTARALRPPEPLGPGTSSKLADSLGPKAPRQGMSQGRPDRSLRPRAARPRDAIAQDPALKPGRPPAPFEALTRRPGERRLRCGGLLAAGGATVRILEDQPRAAVIRLGQGQLGLRVPKLPPGGRLEVVTADARVRVVGTRFTVQRGQQAQTTVRVAAGVVWVTPTGRNRKTVVLRAGESRAVLGEAAYLKRLRGQLTAALSAGRLADAARLGRRYLEVTSRPGGAATMKLRLAGILARLGRTAEAVKLYQDVMGSATHAVARQNALAFLARLYERLGAKPKALAVWRNLVRKHPRGIFTVDALMALVRAGCGQAAPAQERYRQQLAKHVAGHRAAGALLRRCRPGGRRK